MAVWPHGRICCTPLVAAARMGPVEENQSPRDDFAGLLESFAGTIFLLAIDLMCLALLCDCSGPWGFQTTSFLGALLAKKSMPQEELSERPHLSFCQV